jgi:hypothetical protein
MFHSIKIYLFKLCNACSTLFGLSIMSVPDEDYPRNQSCTLNLISTFSLLSLSRYHCNPNNPVVILHSLSIASLTPECIHLGNPSTGRIDSPVNYGYLFIFITREKEVEFLNVCKHVRWND